MKPEYFDLLPEQFQKMVMEIESAIQQEITTRKPEPTDPDFIRSSELAYACCDISNDALIAEIVFPLNETPTHQIAHEVTHIHRCFVQQADRLNAKVQDGGLLDAIANSINNDLEHAFIVPAEIERFPESLAFWEQDFRQQLELARNKPHLSTMSRADAALYRLETLRVFATISLIHPGQWPGIAEYMAVLHHQGLMNDATNLVAKLQKQQHRKADWIATMIRFGKLDPSGFEIARFDTAARTDIKRPVPAW